MANIPHLSSAFKVFSHSDWTDTSRCPHYSYNMLKNKCKLRRLNNYAATKAETYRLLRGLSRPQRIPASMSAGIAQCVTCEGRHYSQPCVIATLYMLSSSLLFRCSLLAGPDSLDLHGTPRPRQYLWAIHLQTGYDPQEEGLDKAKPRNLKLPREISTAEDQICSKRCCLFYFKPLVPATT